MTDAPSEKFDALNPGGFFSDHLDEVQKQWLYAQVMRLINTHSRSAPKTQKLLKPLVEEFFPGKGPPEEIPEDFVLISVLDEIKDNEFEQVFKGWMISSSPSVTPFEHPIYDLWIKDCRIDIDSK